MSAQVILLVEDNADDVVLAGRAFEKMGLTEKVRIAHDGKEALDFLFGQGACAAAGPAAGIQLILLDLGLPKTTGLDVLRQIRQNPTTRHLAVVVLTVSRKEPDLLQSFTMGISDYLIKPLDPERYSQIHRKYVKETAS